MSSWGHVAFGLTSLGHFWLLHHISRPLHAALIICRISEIVAGIGAGRWSRAARQSAPAKGAHAGLIHDIQRRMPSQ
jgi:hypothetical protein